MYASLFQKYDNEIIRKYRAGEDSINIAKDIGCSRRTVLYRLKRNGIKRRSISEALGGRPKSKEHIEKMRQTKIRLGQAKGSRNPNWKGGVQDNWSELKNSKEYKIWRKSVFKKDSYICQGCGYAKGNIIEAHHILRRVDFPHLTLAINNGITLCENCHRRVHSKGANLQLGELLENPTVKSGIISSRALYIEKVQRLCTQPEREDIVRSA